MKHLIGLVLGTEEDWPPAFEHLAARVGRFEWRGEAHELATERVINEPFDLRYRPRYALVLDRVGWWYLLPREWLKKVALMDDVYLLNNPFTFQSMEKHSAYCAMMRLGLKVPDTWLIPHKQPPWNERFPTTAARYNQPFDLSEIGDLVGFPLYLKPFDGGQWRGVTRGRDTDSLRRRYDESGQQLVHVRSAVDDFEVLPRSLSRGPETLVRGCVLCRRRTPDAHRRRSATVVRGRRSRRSVLRGEARRVPTPRRRALPGRRVRGVLRGAAPAPRRGSARMVHERRLRPCDRRDR